MTSILWAVLLIIIYPLAVWILRDCLSVNILGSLKRTCRSPSLFNCEFCFLEELQWKHWFTTNNRVHSVPKSFELASVLGVNLTKTYDRTFYNHNGFSRLFGMEIYWLIIFWRSCVHFRLRIFSLILLIIYIIICMFALSIYNIRWLWLSSLCKHGIAKGL